MNPYESTVQKTDAMKSGSILSIRKMNVISVGRVQGVLGLGLGVLLAIPYALMMLVMGAVAGDEGALIGVGGAIAVALFVPIFYGFAMFLGGLISALLYNLAAGWVGGIEFEIG